MASDETWWGQSAPAGGGRTGLTPGDLLGDLCGAEGNKLEEEQVVFWGWNAGGYGVCRHHGVSSRGQGVMGGMGIYY